MNEPTMEVVAERLNRLERDNRDLKMAGTLALAVMTAVVLMGQASKITTPPPGPEPPPTEKYPSLPAGFKLFSVNTFASKGENGWEWVDWGKPYGRIAEDPTAPLSPPYVLEVPFLVGNADQCAAGSASYSPKFQANAVYVQYAFRFSEGHKFYDSWHNKTLRYFHGPDVLGSGDVLALAGPGQDITTIQAGMAGPHGARNLEPNVKRFPVARGEWVIVEALLQMNTEARRDGKMKLFARRPGQAPTLIFSYEDVYWRNPTGGGLFWSLIGEFVCAGSPNNPVSSTYRCDEVVIFTGDRLP